GKDYELSIKEDYFSEDVTGRKIIRKPNPNPNCGLKSAFGVDDFLCNHTRDLEEYSCSICTLSGSIVVCMGLGNYIEDQKSDVGCMLNMIDLYNLEVWLLGLEQRFGELPSTDPAASMKDFTVILIKAMELLSQHQIKTIDPMTKNYSSRKRKFCENNNHVNHAASLLVEESFKGSLTDTTPSFMIQRALKSKKPITKVVSKTKKTNANTNNSNVESKESDNVKENCLVLSLKRKKIIVNNLTKKNTETKGGNKKFGLSSSILPGSEKNKTDFKRKQSDTESKEINYKSFRALKPETIRQKESESI
ncbi:hypothetical protein BB560_006283, partial [Smittium megazygosporum]